MLDDPNYIQQFDRSNGLALIAGQVEQLKQDFTAPSLKIDNLENIVVDGMGGSALAAELIRSWLGDKLPVPVHISRDYRLPGFVNDKTLVIVSSYSGNTEETLASLDEAKKRQANVVIMTSGGKLAGEHGFPEFTLPSGLPPRLGVLAEAKATAVLLDTLGLTDGVAGEFSKQFDWLLGEVSQWHANVSTAENSAKQIAEKLVGFTPVVYAGPTLAYAAMKWKIDFNENAKNTAFYYLLPEFNHNEILGWTVGPKDRQMAVVELRSNLDDQRIVKRFDVSNKLLSGKMPAPIQIQARGETKLQQILWTAILGDFVSAYLAFLNGIDPIPVDLIEKLKHELAS